MEDDLLDPKDTLDMGFVLVSAVVGENDGIVDIVIDFRENKISKILATVHVCLRLHRFGP